MQNPRISARVEAAGITAGATVSFPPFEWMSGVATRPFMLQLSETPHVIVCPKVHNNERPGNRPMVAHVRIWSLAAEALPSLRLHSLHASFYGHTQSERPEVQVVVVSHVPGGIAHWDP